MAGFCISAKVVMSIEMLLSIAFFESCVLCCCHYLCYAEPAAVAQAEKPDACRHNVLTPTHKMGVCFLGVRQVTSDRKMPHRASTKLCCCWTSMPVSACICQVALRQPPQLADAYTVRQFFSAKAAVIRTCSCCGRRFRESRLPVHEVRAWPCT